MGVSGLQGLSTVRGMSRPCARGLEAAAETAAAAYSREDAADTAH
jgi:hypothetical protein